MAWTRLHDGFDTGDRATIGDGNFKFEIDWILFDPTTTDIIPIHQHMPAGDRVATTQVDRRPAKGGIGSREIYLAFIGTNATNNAEDRMGQFIHSREPGNERRAIGWQR